MCITWPDSLYTLNNFIAFPHILPSILSMLSHQAISIDVASLHFGMIKKIIIETLDTDEIQKRALKNSIILETQEKHENSSASDSEQER